MSFGEIPGVPPTPSRQRILELIQFRLSKWIAMGIVLYVLWGKTNGWPRELTFTALLLPLALLFSQRHYLEHHFARSIPSDIPVWDFMVSCLLLTTGVASGKLTLISIGWVAMGIVFLKPTRVDLNWAEWFKIPVLWIFLFPIWLDFRNSSLNITTFMLGNPLANPIDRSDLSWAYTRFHFGILTSIIVLAGGLRGSLFWKSLPVIPLVSFGYSWLQNRIPAIHIGFGPIQSFLSWLLVPGTVLVLVYFINRYSQKIGLLRIGPTTEFIRRNRFSAFSLWLSFAVIAMQQYNLIKDNYFIEGTLPLNHAAVAIWLSCLLWLRYKTTESNVDSRTRILLALALVFLITGEWTDINFLRHISLGMGVVTMISWKRVWPTGLILSILVTWTMIIPAGQSVTTEAINYGFGNPIILTLTILGNLIVLSIFSLKKNDDLRILNSGDYEWLPSMRFSFLVLILLVSFQLLSSFTISNLPPSPNFDPVVLKDVAPMESPDVKLPGLEGVQFLAISPQSGSKAMLMVGEPIRSPSELPSPLLLLDLLGWDTHHQRLNTINSYGTVMTVEMTSRETGKRAIAAFWWESNNRIFCSQEKAQRILWSSWYYAERNLALYILIKENANNDHIIEVGKKLNQWCTIY